MAWFIIHACQLRPLWHTRSNLPAAPPTPFIPASCPAPLMKGTTKGMNSSGGSSEKAPPTPVHTFQLRSPHPFIPASCPAPPMKGTTKGMNSSGGSSEKALRGAAEPEALKERGLSGALLMPRRSRPGHRCGGGRRGGAVRKQRRGGRQDFTFPQPTDIQCQILPPPTPPLLPHLPLLTSQQEGRVPLVGQVKPEARGARMSKLAVVPGEG